MTPSQRRKLCRYAGFEFGHSPLYSGGMRMIRPNWNIAVMIWKTIPVKNGQNAPRKATLLQLRQRRCDPGAPKQIKTNPVALSLFKCCGSSLPDFNASSRVMKKSFYCGCTFVL
jgi:hypothetical protein